METIGEGKKGAAVQLLREQIRVEMERVLGVLAGSSGGGEACTMCGNAHRTQETGPRQLEARSRRHACAY